MRKRISASSLRVLSLCGFVVFITWIAFMRRGRSAVSVVNPSTDFLGTLEILRTWLSGTAMPFRLAPLPVVVAVAVAAMTLVFGRIFCGWICPIGAIGEFSHSAGRAFRLPRIVVPDVVDGGLKFLKYIILFFILWGALFFGVQVWREIDPWIALSCLVSEREGLAAHPWGYVALFGGVMGAGFFIERFWCRYLCPTGAVLGILGWMAPLEVGNTGSCTGCGDCCRACPVQLDPGRGTVSGAECLVCGRCVDEAHSICRVRFHFAGREVRVLRAGIVALVIFLGGCFVGWKTEIRADAETLPPLREFPKLGDARGGHDLW